MRVTDDSGLLLNCPILVRNASLAEADEEIPTIPYYISQGNRIPGRGVLLQQAAVKCGENSSRCHECHSGEQWVVRVGRSSGTRTG